MNRVEVFRIVRYFTGAALLLLGITAAFAAATPGTLAWKSAARSYWLPLESGQVAPAPVVTATGDIPVIAFDASGQNQHQLASFDEAGNLRWQTPINSPSIIDIFPLATTQEGTTFLTIGQRDVMYVIAADGSQIRNGGFRSYRGVVLDASETRLVSYYHDVFSTANDSIYSFAFNRNQQYTLTQQWRYALSDFQHGFSPAVKPRITTRGGITYALLAPLTPTQVAGEFLAQSCVIAIGADGAQNWRWCDASSAPNSEIVFDNSGNLYFSNFTSVISLTPDGVQRWIVDITGRPLQPAVSANGTLFVNTVAGVGGRKFFYSLNGDGSQRWVLDLDWNLGLGANLTKPLFATDGTIYFTVSILRWDPARNTYVGSANLVAVSVTGQLMWMYDSGEDGDPSSPAFNNDQSRIYFTVQRNSLHAVNAGISQTTASCPIFSNPSLVIHCVNGYDLGARLNLVSDNPLTFAIDAILPVAPGRCATLTDRALHLPCVEGYDLSADLEWGTDDRFRLIGVGPAE